LAEHYSKELSKNEIWYCDSFLFSGVLLISIFWNLLLLFNLADIKGDYIEVKWTLDFLRELLLLNFYEEYEVLD